MLLPPNKAFALYRYDGACQKVLGMRDPVQLFVHFDDEDSRNANSCSGNRPDGPATVVMNSISAIIDPGKKLTNLLNLVTELYDYT